MDDCVYAERRGKKDWGKRQLEGLCMSQKMENQEGESGLIIKNA